MKSDQHRSDYLAALGLIDWQYRDDGPLAPMRAAVPAAISTQKAAKSPEREPDVADAGFSNPAAEALPEGQCKSPSRIASDTSRDASSAPNHGRLAGCDWDQLESHLSRQDHRGAARPVFGIGARDADVLIIGEAPGANEDAEGVPFVGRAGKLLDRMLFAIGCSRETNVYITNICKFRPPGNRDPKADEVAADWPILERQIDLINPKLVVAVGRVAAQTLLNCQIPLGKLRGRPHRYPERELAVWVTYHPAYLLRSPNQKNKAWDDLKRIARHIGARST